MDTEFESGIKMCIDSSSISLSVDQATQELVVGGLLPHTNYTCYC